MPTKKTKKTALNSTLKKFVAARNPEAILSLLPSAILATKAYVKALVKLKYFDRTEGSKLNKRFAQLEKEHKSGKLKLEVGPELLHGLIFEYCTRKYKKLGQKLADSGLSEDLEYTVMAMYMLENAESVKKEAKKSARLFLDLAAKYQSIPLPGKHSEISGMGHYFCYFLESLIGDLVNWAEIIKRVNKSSLGTAKGFGSNMLIDREFMAKEIGLKNLFLNSQYAEMGIKKSVNQYLQGLKQIMMSLEVVAEFALKMTKKDLIKLKDVEALENIQTRARSVEFLSNANAETALLMRSVIESSEITLDSLNAVNTVIKKIQTREKNISKYFGEIDAEAQLKNQLSLGAAGNLDLHFYTSLLKKV